MVEYKIHIIIIGILYDVIFDTEYADERSGVYNNGVTCVERCHTADGEIIDCNNANEGKRCKVCDYYYTKTEHQFGINAYYITKGEEIPYESGNIICYKCDQIFGTYTNKITISSNTPATYTIDTIIDLTNGATFDSTAEMGPYRSTICSKDSNKRSKIYKYTYYIKNSSNISKYI